MAPPTLRLAQDPEADALLARDPLALLMGMLLDQQFPLEWAFRAPWRLAQRMERTSLDAAELAEWDPDAFVKLMAGPPALHRYPASMAARVQALCRIVVDQYGGDAAAIWRTAATGKELLARLRALPGFGEQKARIFVALLGKQLGVQPDGWRPPHLLDRQLAHLRSEGTPLAPSGAAVDLHAARWAASGLGQDAQPSLFD